MHPAPGDLRHPGQDPSWSGRGDPAHRRHAHTGPPGRHDRRGLHRHPVRHGQQAGHYAGQRGSGPAAPGDRRGLPGLFEGAVQDALNKRSAPWRRRGDFLKGAMKNGYHLFSQLQLYEGQPPGGETAAGLHEGTDAGGGLLPGGQDTLPSRGHGPLLLPGLPGNPGGQGGQSAPAGKSVCVAGQTGGLSLAGLQRAGCQRAGLLAGPEAPGNLPGCALLPGEDEGPGPGDGGKPGALGVLREPAL